MNPYAFNLDKMSDHLFRMSSDPQAIPTIGPANQHPLDWETPSHQRNLVVGGRRSEK